MKEEIVEYLCCPVCNSDFTLEILERDNEKIRRGIFICPQCNKIYPITDYIPQILPEKLKNSEKKTVDSFAFEWEYYGCVLSNNLNTEFLTRVQPWKKEDFKNKVVLDVGCGAGRLSRLASDYGAKQVFSIDLGNAVRIARKLSGNYSNINFIQCSLFELPLRQKFDIVFSMGVIHHTPDPSLAFQSILKPLKPGGRIGMWVYSKEGNKIIGLLFNIFRTATKKLNNRTRLFLAKLIVKIEETLYLIFKKIINRIYYGDYLRYFNTKISPLDRESTVFDFISSDIIKYISRDELQQYVRKANLDDVFISKYNNEGSDTKGWSLTARKPEGKG